MARAVHSGQYRRFLKRLRVAREQAGFAQTDVARRLGKPQSFVSKCESGERRVDVIELCAFANVYNLPLSFFVDERARGRRRVRQR